LRSLEVNAMFTIGKPAIEVPATPGNRSRSRDLKWASLVNVLGSLRPTSGKQRKRGVKRKWRSRLRGLFQLTVGGGAAAVAADAADNYYYYYDDDEDEEEEEEEEKEEEEEEEDDK